MGGGGDRRHTLFFILQWPSEIQELQSRLEEITGTHFNSLLCNFYRDGHDSIDWHSDDEPALGTDPTIASLSFGDTRMFEMRKKPLSVCFYLRRQTFLSSQLFIISPLFSYLTWSFFFHTCSDGDSTALCYFISTLFSYLTWSFFFHTCSDGDSTAFYYLFPLCSVV